MFILKQKQWFTDICSCRSRRYQLWNIVKVQHNFTASTRRTTADSSNKTADTIIREPTAVNRGKYSERHVRLALQCLAEKMQTANWGQIFVLLDGCIYLYCTYFCRAWAVCVGGPGLRLHFLPFFFPCKAIACWLAIVEKWRAWALFSEISSVEKCYVPITLVSIHVWILWSWVQLSESTSARGRSEKLLH